MFNTKSILSNAAFTAAAATVTVLAVSPAEAFSLRAGSTLSLTGSGIVQGEGQGNPPSSATLKFFDKPNEGRRFDIGATGDFKKIFSGESTQFNPDTEYSSSDNSDSIADLLLKFTGNYNKDQNPLYSFNETLSFIDFGNESFRDGDTRERGTLVFNLDPGQFLRSDRNGPVSYVADKISGAFVFTPDDNPSSAFAVGNASVQYTTDPNNGAFNITLAVQETTESQSVPEPGTLLGLVAFGFLPFARKKKTTAV